MMRPRGVSGQAGAGPVRVSAARRAASPLGMISDRRARTPSRTRRAGLGASVPAGGFKLATVTESR